MSDQEILIQARDLIKAKQYQDARNLLEPIAKNPTAQKWLAKLDEIAPKPKPKAQESYFDELPPATPEKPDLPAGKPWNPRTFIVVVIMFNIGALFIFALNWRRLGKAWGVETVLLDAFLWVGVIGGLIFSSLTDNETAKIAVFGVVLFCGTGNYLFVLFLSQLQQKAFDKWEKGDVAGMLNHNYKLGMAALTWFGSSLAITIVLSGIFYYQDRPKTFENDTLALTYDSQWEKVANDELIICQNHFAGCFFALADGTYSGFGVFVTFTEFPLNDYTRQQYVNEIKSRQASQNLEVSAQQETMINGVSVFWQEYLFPQDNGDMVQFLNVFFFTDAGQVIHVTGQALEDEYESRSDDIWEIINDIELKANRVEA